MVQPLWKMVCQFLIKLNIQPAIALLCIYLRKKLKIFIQNKQPNKKPVHDCSQQLYLSELKTGSSQSVFQQVSG